TMILFLPGIVSLRTACRLANERNVKIAAALAEGKVVGYFAGRMEFGPRALGARSILGDPRRPETQAVMNLKIKHRESFRPFAPAVLVEDVGDYFDFEGESPYMLMVAPVRGDRRRLPAPSGPGAAQGEDLLALINQTRSDLPAVTHVDHSARIQTVRREVNPDFYDLISEFKRLTGYGVLVNTSFNVRGEPIVCSPRDAYRCFMRTEIDLLVLESYLLWKSDQPPFVETDDWKRQYELD
ncbi:MAG: carbamoyltransferase C-terminal domain-containing protein, partial [Chromatiales bacterium]